MEVEAGGQFFSRERLLLCCRSRKAVNIIEITILIIVLCIVVSLFSLPIVFHFALTTNNNIVLRSNSSSNTNSTSSCIFLPVAWSRLNTTSAGCYNYDVYIGTICRDFLTKWDFCTVGDGHLYVNQSEQSQLQKEKNLITVNTFLVYQKDCQKIALPFLCQYYFPLYDCPNGDIYTASREDCIDISTGVCASLWNLAINYGYGDKLPDCQDLPSAQNYKYTQNQKTQNMSNFTKTCREDFIEINMTCQPRCDKFEQSSHVGTQLLIISEIFACFFGLLVCVLIIGLSIKDYKTMLTYPSILVVFVTIDISIIAILLLIVIIGRNSLLCSSVSLLDSLNTPTTFCTLSGTLFHYCTLNMMFWWFFYVGILFFKVTFPFKANRIEKRGMMKYVFAIMTILALIMPLPPVIVSLIVETYKYNLSRFPPTLCKSSSDMWFYTAVIIDVILAIGVCLLIVVFWTIHRYSLYTSKKDDRKTRLSTGEKKIILVFCTIVVFGVFTLVNVSYNTANTDKLVIALANYFKCEALGYVSGKCNRAEFEQYYNPYVTAIAYILLGLVPLTVLNFVLKWKEVQQFVRKLLQKIRIRKTRKSVKAPENSLSAMTSTFADTVSTIADK